MDSPGCEKNFNLNKRYEAQLKKADAYIFPYDEIPAQCIRYEISIQFESGILNKYKIGYKYSESDAITEITNNDFRISDLETKVSIILVLIDSPGCEPNYILQDTYTAQLSTPYTFGEKQIPYKCATGYYVNFNLEELTQNINIEIYAHMDDETYVKVISNQPITSKNEFEVYLYAKSKYCDEYVELSLNYHHKASRTFETVSIVDSYIPENCLIPMTYLYVKNNFEDFLIEICYEVGTSMTCLESLNMSNLGPFSVDIYYRSYYCSDQGYNFFRTISSKETLEAVILTQDDIKDECKSRYDLCVQIIKDFKYSYTLPEDEKVDVSLTDSYYRLPVTKIIQYNFILKMKDVQNQKFLLHLKWLQESQKDMKNADILLLIHILAILKKIALVLEKLQE